MYEFTNVLLPEKFWEQAQNKEELKRLIAGYMRKSYPDYTVLKVKGKFAVCQINR